MELFFHLFIIRLLALNKGDKTDTDTEKAALGSGGII